MGVLESSRNKQRASALFDFTNGIEVDARLARQEVQVQKAWAKSIHAIRVITSEELSAATRALDEALTLIEADQFEWRVQDEDIHMNLERFVTERCGALGKKLHLGRSRNDLIATTLRLFVRDSADEIANGLQGLALALCDRAEAEIDVLVPGLTHLQNGQPVRFGHVLASHGWAFQRDLQKIRAASDHAMESMPLGSAALGGTTLAVDLDGLARELGFKAPSLNSYDSVGDRDFMLQALNTFALCGVHLSRLSEDLIFWSSTAIGLIRMPEAWSTGSSIMPNKRNPDVPELVRGKAAHLLGGAADGLALVRGVATSYGSDLHELKSVYLRSFDQIKMSLAALTPFVKGMRADPKAAATLLGKGHILATEVADELARRGTPFREAYGQTAALVECAERKGVQIQELSRQDWKSLAPDLSDEFVRSLDAASAVERRSNSGGTSRARVTAGIQALRAKLD